MSSTSPSPNSSPSSVPQTSNPSEPPPPTSQPDQTSDAPLPSTTSDPSAPPPSPPPSPPAVSATPLPLPLLSPPSPSTPPPTSPPPSPPASSPPSPPASPPPSPPASPSTSTPPSPSIAPPPTETSPPPPTETSPPPPTDILPPPPTETSPPPPNVSPPLLAASSPRQASPGPPELTSPPSKASPSPPPPANVPMPPSSNSPPPVPPPVPSKPPENFPPPPQFAAPTGSTLPSPPPTVPSTSSPPTISSPGPPSNSSAAGSPTVSPLPAIPTEKPTAKSTNETNLNNVSSTHTGGLNTGGAIAIGTVVGIIMLSIVVMAGWFLQKRKKKGMGSKVGHNMPSPFSSSQNSGTLFLRPYSPQPLVGSGSGSDFLYSPSEAGGISNSRSWFMYEELAQATDGFSAKNLLGEGGFGCVYKGLLRDGREVAVKQLKVGGGQGEREFRAEVEIISRVHHRHLVSLVGYCISEHQRLLIYDYVPNDTLHYHLHGEDKTVMDWATRIKVAAGAARGIAYLHEDCHPRIIHRDIKSSNILLDNNFEAQVADFGLAKLALDSYTHVTTRVMGTFGYMAPEYATSGKLTEKSDVYSFGVVLLELITGRKPVDGSQPVGEESLVEWARPLLSHALESEDFEGLVDQRLEKTYVENEMFRMIEAAAACVRHSAAKRPRMSQVVRALDSLDEFSDLSNGMKPGQSEVFDAAQQSAQIKMFWKMAFGSQDSSSIFFNETHSSWKSRDPGSPSSLAPSNRSGPWNV